MTIVVHKSPGVLLYKRFLSYGEVDRSEIREREDAIRAAVGIVEPCGANAALYAFLHRRTDYTEEQMVAIASVTAPRDPALTREFWLDALAKWNETHARQSTCKHQKVYSNTVLTSNPPQYPWICGVCGLESVDRPEPIHRESYGDVKKRLGIE